MKSEIMRQVEKDIQSLEEKYQRIRARNEAQALEDIDGTRALFQKRKALYGYELKQLDKMESYVKKHKFIPESYNNMLRMWTANFLGKYSR